MSTLVVGDVHGCADELAELLHRTGPDRVVLVGDVFTKGPDPVGVWRLVQEVRPACVRGNHDQWLLDRWGRADPRQPGLDDLMGRDDAAAVRSWLEALPLTLAVPGPDAVPTWVVHAGVDPVRGLHATTARTAMHVRRWPDDGDPAHPFWYDFPWRGPERIVFGHDAMRGLVRREVGGVLLALGLDSGCVYGNQLTGWLAEEDRLVQVQARGVWRGPGP